MLTQALTGAAALAGASEASLALAGGGVEIDFDLTFVMQMVVFAALIIVLKPLLADPVLNLFQAREDRTDGARASAREMQEKAGELLRRYERELERVNRVAAEERDRMRAETSKLEGEILQEARSAAASIVEEGRARLDEEVMAIRFDLGRESERLAREIAARVLRKPIR